MSDTSSNKETAETSNPLEHLARLFPRVGRWCSSSDSEKAYRLHWGQQWLCVDLNSAKWFLKIKGFGYSWQLDNLSRGCRYCTWPDNPPLPEWKRLMWWCYFITSAVAIGCLCLLKIATGK